MTLDPDEPVTQSQFAELVGITQPTVSRLQADGVLPAVLVLGPALLAYCDRLREAAAGRHAEGGISLATERALLAREQRLNVRSRRLAFDKQLVPLDDMKAVLSTVAAAAAEQFEHMRADMRRLHALPGDVLDTIERHVHTARHAMADGIGVALTEAAISGQFTGRIDEEGIDDEGTD